MYVYFGSTGLVTALNMSGEIVWTSNVGAFNGGQEFGTAASPALHDGRLYIVNDNTDGSFLAAFDAESGEEIWRAVQQNEEMMPYAEIILTGLDELWATGEPKFSVIRTLEPSRVLIESDHSDIHEAARAAKGF